MAGTAGKVPLDGNLESPKTHAVEKEGEPTGETLVTGQPVKRRKDVRKDEAPGGYHTPEGGPTGSVPPDDEA